MLLLFPCSLFLDHVFSGVGPQRALIKVIMVMPITVMDLHPAPAQHCCIFFFYFHVYHFTPSARGSMVPIWNAGETKACDDSGALHSSQTLANPR